MDTNPNDSERTNKDEVEVATNIAGSFKQSKKNKPIKSSVNVEADYLSMSSAQMKNHLNTVQTLVEENNTMKE